MSHDEKLLSGAQLARGMQASAPACRLPIDHHRETPMTMQRLCHEHPHWSLGRSLVVLTVALLWPTTAVRAAPPVHDYPTQARVEFVNECIANHGNSLANVYQCSCAIDRIADRLSYDDFVAAITFARYSGLPGEGGAVFRDSDEAKQTAKMYRELEKAAFRTCGVTPPP